ncbi:MAG TPA: Atu4866 domain-containing protein [Actinoplanes sp.]|jgi:hypothetical protein
MRIHHDAVHPDAKVDTTVLDSASLLAVALVDRGASAMSLSRGTAMSGTAPVGAWRSADGAVRLDIRTDGTYAGKVAGRRREAHGTYDVEGGTMTLLDDSGLHTPVTLLPGELEMAGHRLLSCA